MRIKAAIFSLFLSVNLFASDNTFVEIENFSLWTGTYGSDTIRVQIAGGVANPHNCSDPDSYMVGSTLPETVRDRIYATLLSATFANKKVKIVINGCENNRPKINTVVVEQGV